MNLSRTQQLGNALITMLFVLLIAGTGYFVYQEFINTPELNTPSVATQVSNGGKVIREPISVVDPEAPTPTVRPITPPTTSSPKTDTEVTHENQSPVIPAVSPEVNENVIKPVDSIGDSTEMPAEIENDATPIEQPVVEIEAIATDTDTIVVAENLTTDATITTPAAESTTETSPSAPNSTTINVTNPLPESPATTTPTDTERVNNEAAETVESTVTVETPITVAKITEPTGTLLPASLLHNDLFEPNRIVVLTIALENTTAEMLSPVAGIVNLYDANNSLIGAFSLAEYDILGQLRQQKRYTLAVNERKTWGVKIEESQHPDMYQLLKNTPVDAYRVTFLLQTP